MTDLAHENFVLDTSIFTNPEIYQQFGEDPQTAMDAFLALARNCPASFYMPTSVYEELCLVRREVGVSPDFCSVVKIRSPRRFSLQVPAEFLYEFIDEVRSRINRGLRVAEEHARMVGQQATEEVIHRLRQRYRDVLRQGIIDSSEDVDVLLLAYELDAVLLSADEGLRRWADKVGIKLLDPKNLFLILDRLVAYHRPGDGSPSS